MCDLFLVSCGKETVLLIIAAPDVAEETHREMGRLIHMGHWRPTASNVNHKQGILIS